MDSENKEFFNVVEVAFDVSTLPEKGELVWLTIVDRTNQKTIDDVMAIFDDKNLCFYGITNESTISIVDVISWKR